MQHESQYAYNRPAGGQNGLGLAGFIVSLVGIIFCGGFISPVGMIMSAVAMRRQPKGFAIAGFVIGLIGSLWLIGVVIAIAFAGLAVILAFVGAAVAVIVASAVGQNAIQVVGAVNEYYDQHNAYPASLDDLADVSQSQRTDFWGNEFRYELAEDGQAFYLRSDGDDEQPGTNDDIVFYRRKGENPRWWLEVEGERIAEGEGK